MPSFQGIQGAGPSGGSNAELPGLTGNMYNYSGQMLDLGNYTGGSLAYGSQASEVLRTLNDPRGSAWQGQGSIQDQQQNINARKLQQTMQGTTMPQPMGGPGTSGMSPGQIQTIQAGPNAPVNVPINPGVDQTKNPGGSIGPDGRQLDINGRYVGSDGYPLSQTSGGGTGVAPPTTPQGTTQGTPPGGYDYGNLATTKFTYGNPTGDPTMGNTGGTPAGTPAGQGNLDPNISKYFRDDVPLWAGGGTPPKGYGSNATRAVSEAGDQGSAATEIYGPTANGSQAVGTPYPVYDMQGKYLRTDKIEPPADNSMWDLAFAVAFGGGIALDGGLSAIGHGVEAGVGPAATTNGTTYLADSFTTPGNLGTGTYDTLGNLADIGPGNLGGVESVMAPLPMEAGGLAAATAGTLESTAIPGINAAAYGAVPTAVAVGTALTAAEAAAKAAKIASTVKAVSGVVSGVQDITGNGGGKNGSDVAANLAAKSDPFAKYRDGYGEKLADLEKNPNHITARPGYEAGLQAVERSMAAQGYQGSGNMMAALAKYGGDFYTKEVTRLAGLAGANVTPGNGLDTAAQIESAAEAARQFQTNKALNSALQLISLLGSWSS